MIKTVFVYTVFAFNFKDGDRFLESVKVQLIYEKPEKIEAVIKKAAAMVERKEYEVTDVLEIFVNKDQYFG